MVVAARVGAAMLASHLTTALVARLKFMPRTASTAIGTEFQRPLATAVIGGIVSSTLLVLLALPTLYALFERDEDAETDENSEAEEKLSTAEDDPPVLGSIHKTE